MEKDLSFVKGLYFAHRGLHDNSNKVPENSKLAFKKAVVNQRAIEFDLHILKDHKIVVFHDDNLKRMTGYDKEIRDCTYEEIKDLRLLNTSEKIPLLEEVLDLVDGRVVMNIEFKYDTKAGMLEKKACELLDCYKGRFLVQSFSPYSVKWFKDNRSGFIRGQLSSDFKKAKMNVFKKFIFKNMFLNKITKPDFIAYDIHAITKEQTVKWRTHMPLLLWTIRTKEELAFATEYADSLIYEKMNLK